MLKRQNIRYSLIWVSVLLCVAVFLVYAPVASYGFVDYDDDLYVSANQHVQQGLTWAGVKWAFSSVSLFYWHPLTWLSHMVDFQLFGSNPGAFHLVNVGIHTVNSVLVFLLFGSLLRNGIDVPQPPHSSHRNRVPVPVFQHSDRTLWLSAIVAGLFALHPLRVESVAWISERKDVLSAFFGLLTVWAYVRYSRHKDWIRYAWTMLAFGCALMSKPTVVTLPVALLALDYWPLKRLSFGKTFSWKIVAEKLPLAGMSIAVTLVTVAGQEQMGATMPSSVSARCATALSAYVSYLGMLIWPHNLSVMYPYSPQYSWVWIITCVTVLIVITGAVVFFAKIYPFLCFGWFWYVLMLLPMSGLIRQAGPQALADRFTYLPCIGLFVAVVWLVADRIAKTTAVAIAVFVLAALGIASAGRVSVWKNSVTLFTDAATAAPESAVIQHNLAYGLAQDGRYAESIPHYRQALAIDPKLFRADYNLGRALYETGAIQEAIAHFQKALDQSLPPEYESDVRNALGIALVRQGDPVRGKLEFARALRLKPNSPELYANLGSCLAMQGNLKDAIVEYRNAVRLKSDYAEAHRNLGIALWQSGQRDEAEIQLETALRLNPGDQQAEHFIEILRSRH